MKKEEQKVKCLLAMGNQEKGKTWAKKKLDGIASFKARPRKVWMNKEDGLLNGRRSSLSLH